MDTLHLNTYLHLIEALLQCTKGEEWLLLQQHEELIDAELISVMARVTEQLNDEGNLPAAKFLNYWTAQLSHLLHQNSNTEASTGSVDPSITTADQRQPDLATTPTIPPQFSNQIETLLINISSRLEKLETSINKHQNPANPLWYMSILEQADAQGWIVSSEEVEQLIGTKPHCAPDRNSFVRGCWKFEKAGKVGLHSSWRVTKIAPVPIAVTAAAVPNGITPISTASACAPRTPTPKSTKLELDLSSPWAETSEIIANSPQPVGA